VTTYLPYTPSNLRYLIESTLKPLNLYSSNAEELLLATCAQESAFGTFRVQSNGPARGIFQMEKEDHDDIWTNYLKYHDDLSGQIKDLAGGNNTAEVLINNDPYAIAMARVHYARKPGTLPSATDLNGLWNYYKEYYNTPLGAATQGQFFHNYKYWVTDGQAI